MSVISKLTMLGAAGAGGESYFINLVYSTSGSWVVSESSKFCVVENSSGIIGSLNKFFGNNNSRALLSIFNPNGELSSNVQIDDGGTADTDPVSLVSIDSDFYSTIVQNDNDGKIFNILVKVSDTGTLTWQAIEGASGSSGHVPFCSTATGNSIVQGGGTRNSGSSFDFGYLNKYSTSGSRQFISVFGNGGTDWQVFCVVTDSAGNIFTASRNYSFTGGVNVSGEANISINKFNSSGSHQSQVTFGHNFGDTPVSMEIDSSGNIYLNWRSQGGGSFASGRYLTKFNSSFSEQWTKYFGSGIIVNDTVVDSNGDIIASVYDASNLLIVKINSDGNIVYQRELTSTASINAYSVNVNANNDILVSGEQTVTGTSGIFVAKLRGDGTGLGTFGGYTYQASSSVTLSSSSISISGNGFSTTTPSISVVSTPTISLSSPPNVTSGNPQEL